MTRGGRKMKEKQQKDFIKFPAFTLLAHLGKFRVYCNELISISLSYTQFKCTVTLNTIVLFLPQDTG